MDHPRRDDRRGAWSAHGGIDPRTREAEKTLVVLAYARFVGNFSGLRLTFSSSHCFAGVAARNGRTGRRDVSLRDVSSFATCPDP
jgi:hypothetical protein